MSPIHRSQLPISFDHHLITSYAKLNQPRIGTKQTNNASRSHHPLSRWIFDTHHALPWCEKIEENYLARSCPVPVVGSKLDVWQKILSQWRCREDEDEECFQHDVLDSTIEDYWRYYVSEKLVLDTNSSVVCGWVFRLSEEEDLFCFSRNLPTY